MLFKQATLARIEAGEITTAFRRWRCVAAAELATMAGEEKRKLKTKVRKLKELGLMESLRVGYRLSPRGRVVLRRL